MKALGKLRAWLVEKGLPARMGMAIGVVTIAFSQMVFSIHQSNLSEFPEEGSYHLWVLIWTWALPVFGLFLADIVFVGSRRVEGPLARGWRSGLYALLALSFAHQVRVRYAAIPEGFEVAVSLAASGVYLLLFAAFLRCASRTDLYMSTLGILGLLLVGRHVVLTGLHGPAWSGDERPTASGERRSPLPPIFILVFDELSSSVLTRNGRIDRSSFPRFAALADESVWIPGATTSAGLTPQAVRSMLTGRLPGEPEDPTLFDLLPAGYESEAIVAWPPVARWMKDKLAGNPRFHIRLDRQMYSPGPLEIVSTLAQGLIQSDYFRNLPRKGHFDDPGDWQLRSAEHRLEAEITALTEASRKETSSGRLLYWHSSLPHFPFQYDESGRPHRDRHRTFVGARPEDHEAVLANYVRQVKATDGLLGRFLDHLKSEGLYERSIVVVTGDHGLRTWNRVDPQAPDRLPACTAGVPILIKAPGLSPSVLDVDYQHVDLTPTILGLLGGSRRLAEGESVFSETRPVRKKRMAWLREHYEPGPEPAEWERIPR